MGHDRLLFAAAMVAVIGSCSHEDGSDSGIQKGQIVGGGTVQMTDVRPVPGFLPNTSLLVKGPVGGAALSYLNQAANFAQYDKVLLDPVTIWAPPDSKLSAVSPAERQTLADGFNADLKKSLAKKCTLVTEAAPGVMRIRIALVDTKTANATVNTIATYAPYLNVGYNLASNLLNKEVGYFAGTATAEGYAVDATDGTLLWEGLDKRGGTTSMAENTLNTWLDVQHAFEAWSEQLAARIQETGACRKAT
jgi:hypothetical protein